MQLSSFLSVLPLPPLRVCALLESTRRVAVCVRINSRGQIRRTCHVFTSPAPAPYPLPAGYRCCSSGATAHLRGLYGALVVDPSEGADFTVVLRRPSAGDATPGGTPTPATEELIRSVALMRRHAMTVPFRAAMAAVALAATPRPAAAPAPTPAALLPAVITLFFRPHEPLFIVPRSDRVSIIYALEFEDPTDRAIARIIAQEFVECQRSITNAPPVMFYDREGAAPAEVRAAVAAAPRQTDAFVGYLSFALLPRHCDGGRAEATLTQMTLLRTYLDYHIKAAKSFLHCRMRTRVEGWQLVLNRARPEAPAGAGDKEKKLITGRTFVRKA